MVLTERQEAELETAILEYLNIRSDRFSNTIEAFKEEARIEESSNANSISDVLARRWVSVGRLQRKLLEFESNISNSAVDGAKGNISRPGRERVTASKCLPRPPAKNVLVGHRSAVSAVAMHPVYTVMVSGGDDATIRVWDLELGQQERSLKGHTNSIQSLAFSPDGSLLASSSVDATVKLWNFETSTYECMHTLRGHDHTVSSVSWIRSPGGNSGEGAHLASCGRDQTIRLWDAVTGYSVGVLTGHEAWIRSISALEGDTSGGNSDSFLVSGGNDTTVRVWAISSGSKVSARCEHILRGHTHVVECVAFSGGLSDRAINSGLGNNSSSMNGGSLENDSTSTSFAPVQTGVGRGGEYVVSGARDKAIKVWSLLSGGTCVATFSDHNNWVRQISFHPFGGYLLSCSDDRSIKIYDLKSMRCTRTIEDAHGHFISCISMHTNAAYLATGSIDKSVHVWECH